MTVHLFIPFSLTLLGQHVYIFTRTDLSNDGLLVSPQFVNIRTVVRVLLKSTYFSMNPDRSDMIRNYEKCSKSFFPWELLETIQYQT